MGSHCTFEHLKHKLWPKEGAGSRIASLTPDQKKSGIDPIYLAVDDVPHTVGKLQLCFRPHFDVRSAREVMGFQSPGSPGWRDFGSPAGVPGEKSHLDVGPVERCRVCYKGEGGGFP